MTSERLHEGFSALWSVAEHRARPHGRRSAEDQASAETRLQEIQDARKDLHGLTDRQFAAKYPKLTQHAVTRSMWEKIKPEARDES